MNLKGRESGGIVDPADYEAVRDEITARFHSLVDPDDGAPVLDRMFKKEEVIEGPEAADGPDLFPVCRDYTYELSEGLYSSSVLTDYRHLPRGFHHMNGIFGVTGPGVPSASGLLASVLDVAPTTLYLAGLDLPVMDGRVITEALPGGMLAERPIAVRPMDLPLAGDGTESSPYSADEEQQIEESLRNLGYL